MKPLTLFGLSVSSGWAAYVVLLDRGLAEVPASFAGIMAGAVVFVAVLYYRECVEGAGK